MRKVLLLDVVGLTPRHLGDATPHLSKLAQRGASAPLRSLLPAVTCTAQATYLTGRLPAEHGAVGNGWYFRDLAEVMFWRQSNALVHGEKLYETARREVPGFRAAKLFWWWNQGAQVDLSITPKPYYGADGSKLLSIYTTPADLKDEVERAHGAFPFFDFWGPKAGLPSSRWIADVTRHVLAEHDPTLTLCYLPHLDYDLQRFGPDSAQAAQALREVDAVVGDLVAEADARGVTTVAVSEYGIERVDRPVHLNRRLREAGLLAVRDGPLGETLDVFASRAFAVADHQVAHVYVADESDRATVRDLLERVEGVERVLGAGDQQAVGLAHPNTGDLVAVAAEGAWFTYYYWLDDARAPDFARTVDIHRKPGYDPCEMFLDPALRHPRVRIARRLAQKKLGMRYLMDVIPLDATLVRGSHGRVPADVQDGPVFLCSEPFERCGGEPEGGVVEPTSVASRVLTLLTGRKR